ncbi:hypothetical protein N7470_000206 [Penicillium chermesinum]|nr:hypothetical protein N7470_000206 [Penicillium chermesinum]
MLHLLNPMSLLARRRSSQMAGSRVEDAKINTSTLVPAIPDDYDPRIRGKIVHDFSAPRAPRRNVSGISATAGDGNNALSAQDLSPASRWNGQARPHSDHSPVFKEHFEDNQKVLQIENKGYLQSSLLTSSTPPGYDKSIPVFAKKLPSALPDQAPSWNGHYENLPAELPGDFPPASPADVFPEHSMSLGKPSGPIVQPDQDTIPHVPHPAATLPKHLKSNASSRFSFDMGGVESSVQEKLLEERHKEHKAKEAQLKLENGYFDDFDEDFDHDMMDDYDDLEEKNSRTPMVSRNINGELKSWAVPGLSPVVASPITPAPAETMAPPGHSASEESLNPARQYNGGFELSHNEKNQPHHVASQETLKASTSVAETPNPEGHQPYRMRTEKTQALADDDDDLYFDDGEFGDLSLDDQSESFDESIFDDETSHLYERKTVDKAKVPQPEQDKGRAYDEILDEDVLHEEDTPQGLKHMPSVASEYGVNVLKRGPLGDPIPNMGPARAHGGVLTEQNLEVLHNALAFAAHEAAGPSRFERTFSTSSRSLAQESISLTSQTDDSQPGLTSDDSRLSQYADMIPFDGGNDDYFYDEDGYFDDPIIAAANAEALENDDEGFYGQEFGFYAQAHGTSNAELVNGGYFGPRGVEGVAPLGAHSNPALASPGLAQLVDMGNLDDEMTLSALMKLRRGAWGGSNGSLRSSAGSPPPHPLPSSNRGSFTGASEASPSDFRTFPDDAPVGVSPPRDENVPHTASPLKDRLGQSADLPPNGPMYAGFEEELPSAGAAQHFNEL